MTDRFGWLDELPLPLGAPHLRMGLRGLDPTDWLPVDEMTSAELVRKQELLDRHDDLVLLDDGWGHAVEELVGVMEIALGHPIDRSRAADPIDLLRIASLEVPDDLLLLAKSDHWRLIGGSLVFPNQWRLSEKMGGTLAEIHAPVDGYDELLADRVDQFFDRLAVNRIVWRRNWFFHDEPDFFQPDRMDHRAFDDPADVDELHLRSEWQTLRRLAFSGVIVFTVKTQVAPMSEVLARPALCAGLVEFLERADEISQANKDASGRVTPLLDRLRASARSANT